MNASILSVGTELSTGQSVDTNAAWLAAELMTLGFRVVEHTTVGDDVEQIAGSVTRLLGHSGVLIVTGGLGPTPDDLTWEGIARAIGQPLEENADAVAQIRAFFARLGRELSPSNLRQAMAPRGCSIIPNDRGTAPGMRCRLGERLLFALPGVPDGSSSSGVGSYVSPLISALSSSIISSLSPATPPTPCPQ